MKAAQKPAGTVPTKTSSGFGKSIEKILDFLMNAIETAGAFLLTVMTLIIIWQIFARFRIIHIISPWTEEVAMILLVWFGLTGAAIGIRKHLHIGVEFVTTLFPESAQKIMMIFVDMLLAGFSLFLAGQGDRARLGAEGYRYAGHRYFARPRHLLRRTGGRLSDASSTPWN